MSHIFIKKILQNSFLFLIEILMLLAGVMACNNVPENSTDTIFISKTPEVITSTLAISDKSEKSVYLVAAKSFTQAQVWSYFPEEKFAKVFTMTTSTTVTFGTVLLSNEVQALEVFLASNDVFILPSGESLTRDDWYLKGTVTSGSEVKVKPRYTHLMLSPTNQELAYQNDYCVFVLSGDCFGVEFLKIVNLKTNQTKELLRMPHISIPNQEYYDNFLWSPDGRYLAYVQVQENHGIESSFQMIIDVQTGKTQKFPGSFSSRGGVLWSPDSTMIAYIPVSSSIKKTTGGTIQLCNIKSNDCRNIQLDGLWISNEFDNRSFDWSPDGKEIIFSAKTTPYHTSPSENVGVYRLNLVTENIIQIPVEKELGVPIDKKIILSNPRWSSDGNWIAVDYYTENTPGNLTPETITINPTTGKIFKEFPFLGNKSIWVNNQTLWMITDHYPNELIIYNLDGGIFQTKLPGELDKMNIVFGDEKLDIGLINH